MTVFARLAAGDGGTCAQAWANGAAFSVAPGAAWLEAESRATLLIAPAAATSIKPAMAAPAKSQRRLCMDSLRSSGAGSLRRAAQFHSIASVEAFPVSLLRRDPADLDSSSEA